MLPKVNESIGWRLLNIHFFFLLLIPVINTYRMNNLFSQFNGLDSGYIRYLSSRHNLFFENLKMEGLNQYSIFVTAMFVCSSKPFFLV